MRSFFVFGFSETNWNVTHNFIKSVTVFQEILKSTTGIRKRFEKKGRKSCEMIPCKAIKPAN